MCSNPLLLVDNTQNCLPETSMYHIFITTILYIYKVNLHLGNYSIRIAHEISHCCTPAIFNINQLQNLTEKESSDRWRLLHSISPKKQKRGEARHLLLYMYVRWLWWYSAKLCSTKCGNMTLKLHTSTHVHWLLCPFILSSKFCMHSWTPGPYPEGGQGGWSNPPKRAR